MSYGVIETNPLSAADKANREAANKTVYWTEPGLYITRLRLLSDPGFPFWDVSYCYGELNGTPVRVQVPFSQLPKKNMKAALYEEAKKTGRFIKGLFDNISTLN